MNNFTLYMHTVPNGKKYIGITKRNPKERWNRGSGYRSNEEFYQDIKKYGWGNIKHEILLSNISQEEAEEWEIKMIAKHDTTNPEKGYNFSKGGGYGGKGGDGCSDRLTQKLKSRAVSCNSKPCMCLETKTRYPSVSAAAKAIHAPRGSVDTSCLSNGKRSVKGKHFVYADSTVSQEAERQRFLRESYSWEWEW